MHEDLETNENLTVKPTSWLDYTGAILIMLIFFGGIAFVWNITRDKDKLPQQRPIVECPPTIEDYQNTVSGLGKVAPLLSSPTSSYGENGQFKRKAVIITKIETEKSKIACGYFSIRVHTGKGGLLYYENVYINPNQFGGHVSSKNQFGPGDGQDYSNYIFSLNNIEYWPTRNNRTIRKADWASLLNVSSEVTFEIGLNTTDPTGIIDEATIVYKCWDPKTGEENKNCKIEVKPATDRIIKEL